MRLGISSYTYNWECGIPGYPPPRRLTAAALLERAAELGVDLVQIADNLPLHELGEAELAELVRRARGLGVGIEAGTRGIAPDHLLLYLRLAERVGSPILRTVIDTEAHRPSPDETVATLRGVMGSFESAGVTLAIENHDRFRAATLLEILERTGSPRAGVCFDTVNSFGCGEGPDAVLAALAPHVVNLHVKDYAVSRLPHGRGFLIEGRPAGQGQLDIPAVLGKLREAGRDVNAILELWSMPEAEVSRAIEKEAAWAQESIRYLRTVVPG